MKKLIKNGNANSRLKVLLCAVLVLMSATVWLGCGGISSGKTNKTNKTIKVAQNINTKTGASLNCTLEELLDLSYEKMEDYAETNELGSLKGLKSTVLNKDNYFDMSSEDSDTTLYMYMGIGDGLLINVTCDKATGEVYDLHILGRNKNDDSYYACTGLFLSVIFNTDIDSAIAWIEKSAKQTTMNSSSMPFYNNVVLIKADNSYLITAVSDEYKKTLNTTTVNME